MKSLVKNGFQMSALGAAFALFISIGAAFAQQPVNFTTQSGNGYGRILASWPEAGNDPNLAIDAKITNGVLVVHFSQTLTADPKPILEGLGTYVALARMDADGQTLRIALRKPAEVRTSKSYNVFAIDLLEPDSTINPPKVQSATSRRLAKQQQEAKQHAAAELEKAKRAARPAPALPLQVRYAQSADNTRITFDWTEEVDFRVLERKDGLDLIFDRPASPSMAELNAAQPAGFMSAKSIIRRDKTIIGIEKAPGFSHRTSLDGTYVVLDLYRPGQEEPIVHAQVDIEPEHETPESTLSRSQRPDPVPTSGIVPIKVAANGSSLQVKFDWAAPVGAAVFRRGDAIWIIFDANAQIGLAELTNGISRHAMARKTFYGRDYSGIQITTPASTQVEARPNGDGSSWTIILDDKLQFPTKEITLRREADGSGPGRLAAKLKNAVALLRVQDEEVGDELMVVTGIGPARGIANLHKFVEVTALPSAQGLAFEVRADALNIELAGDLLTINSRLGLNLTPSATPLHLATNSGEAARLGAAPAITASPGFMDFEAWQKLGGEGLFQTAYSALLRQVAIEDTNPEARMNLARFLISHELGAEALGALALAQALDPMLVQDARFRALRGVANLQMNRIKIAKADFSAQTLNRDPSAALWRGYLGVKTENWTEARQNFEKGREAFYLFTPEWQAKFHTAFALAAMNLNDLGTATEQLQEIFGNGLSLPTQLEASMARAEFMNRSGEPDQALTVLDNVIATNFEPLAVRAIFEKVRIQQASGNISPLEASDVLENLRFRWRGDEVELEAVRTLGSFYSQAGDYRRAMEAMSLAVRRFPNSPVARRLQTDLRDTFIDLFLNGGADSMDPVQAVALFYEFQEFAPLGTDGDRMSRRMADRLIAFDLLPQAAELLQYQIDQKLFGIGKAQVATDLALVYLMDHQPEKSLRAIRSSRQARLPKALNKERRLLEARALVEMGREEHALDLIEMDRTKEADFLRADIVWAGKQWPQIAAQLNKTISKYVRATSELSDEDAALVLRTALASALSDDQTAFRALVEKWEQPMSKTSSAEAFAMISSRTSLSGVEVKDLARTIGATDTMRSYLEQYRNRVAKRAPTDSLGQAATTQSES